MWQYVDEEERLQVTLAADLGRVEKLSNEECKD